MKELKKLIRTPGDREFYDEDHASFQAELDEANAMEQAIAAERWAALSREEQDAILQREHEAVEEGLQAIDRIIARREKEDAERRAREGQK